MSAVHVVLLSALGLVACGPVLGVLLFFLLWAIIILPLELFVDVPTWTFWPIGILAAILTVLVVVGLASSEIQEFKDKELIHEADVKRAKKELGRKG